MGAVVNLQCSPALLAPLFPCQFAKAMAASKDPVAHAGAGAVGKQLAVQPAGPLLILEVAAQAEQRNAGARKVVVRIDALELVKAKPAAFGLKLIRERELHVREGAADVK